MEKIYENIKCSKCDLKSEDWDTNICTFCIICEKINSDKCNIKFYDLVCDFGSGCQPGSTCEDCFPYIKRGDIPDTYDGSKRGDFRKYFGKIFISVDNLNK